MSVPADIAKCATLSLDCLEIGLHEAELDVGLSIRRDDGKVVGVAHRKRLEQHDAANREHRDGAANPEAEDQGCGRGEAGRSGETTKSDTDGPQNVGHDQPSGNFRIR